RIMRQLMGGRMYAVTLEGLVKAVRELVRYGAAAFETLFQTRGADRLVIALRFVPAAHARQAARGGAFGHPFDPNCHRREAVRHLVRTVDAVGAFVAKHIPVSERHSDFSFDGETRLRLAGVDIGLLDHHAVDDGTTAFDGDAVTLHRNDAFDVVDLLL